MQHIQYTHTLALRQKKIIVTGGAGFIGSNLIEQLNALGYERIVVVDNLSNPDKFKNIRDLKITEFIDKQDFLNQIHTFDWQNVLAIFHQGACSNTMEQDGNYMMRNNFSYSQQLFLQAVQHRIPLFYASSAAVYGDLQGFTERMDDERPLNIYGYSKLLFDRYVEQYLSAHPEVNSSVVGLRYFNVYGPREFHKGKMASVAFHHYQQYCAQQSVKLFGAYQGYGAGEHTRDFIYVKDVVDVNLFFFERALNAHANEKAIQDVFNLGTGQAEPFNQIAHTMVNQFQKSDETSATETSLAQLIVQKYIIYIDFPAALIGKYQTYTQANIAKLRQVGYGQPFYTVKQGCMAYYDWLQVHASNW